jgi:hypothetical protein
MRVMSGVRMNEKRVGLIEREGETRWVRWREVARKRDSGV